MNSEDYRQILKNERIEMNAEDFDSTLTHFAKLYHKEQTQEIYKGFEIAIKPNLWGYFEAISTTDCDAQIIYAKTVSELKIEIDEHK